METTNKVNLRNSLEENIRLYPESWTDPDALEDYVKALWDAESDRANDFGEEFPTYTEYLKLHIELIWEIKENGDLPKISFELEDILSWYENGRFEDASGNTIDFEAHNGVVYNFVWSENPNFDDDPENEMPMVWCLEVLDGPHYEGDDFEYLYEAIEDLVQTIVE